MGFTIKIKDGYTLETLETTDFEHTNDNVKRLSKKYERLHGNILKMDNMSDCITIIEYENGKVLGFTI